MSVCVVVEGRGSRWSETLPPQPPTHPQTPHEAGIISYERDSGDCVDVSVQTHTQGLQGMMEEGRAESHWRRVGGGGERRRRKLRGTDVCGDGSPQGRRKNSDSS